MIEISRTGAITTSIGDRARRHAHVVARLDHHRPGEDAEQHHRRAYRARGDAEQRRRQDHHYVQGAAHRGEQVAESLEQSFHHAGLVADVAHEDEQGHRHEFVLLHHAEGLQVGEVEHLRAQAHVAEDQGEEQQREADRQADEDGRQHHHQHQRTEELQSGHVIPRASRGAGIRARSGSGTST
jgi:hypothetical protein